MPENNSTIPPLVFGAPSLSFYGIYPRHLERFTPISLPQLFRYGYYNMNEVEITHGEAEYCLKNGEQIKVYPAFPIWDCYFRYSNELLSGVKTHQTWQYNGEQGLWLITHRGKRVD